MRSVRNGRGPAGRNGNGRSWLTRMGRLIRYRLLIPIKRSVHSPKFTARGVAVGLAWGLTPTVGIQMGLCFIMWVVTRRLFKWDFSLIIAMAWTWSTNVLTMFPCYYLFYITGQLMLGRFDDLSGYGEFMSLWSSNVGDDSGVSYWVWLWAYMVTLVKGWGLPMAIGCLPWSALGAWAGYVWSLRFTRRHRDHRDRRRHERRLQREAARAAPAQQRP